MSIDTDAIRAQFPIRPYLEGKGYKFKFNKCQCPLHDDKTPSLSVSKAKDGSDRFTCHASSCGKRGDIVQLVREMEGCSMPEAVEILTGQKPVTGKPPAKPNGHDRSEPTPLQRTWTAVPSRQIPTWKAGQVVKATMVNGKVLQKKPVLLHRYLDTEGRLIAMVARVPTDDGGKAILPLRFINGEWMWKGFGEGELAPIYGYHMLAKYPELPVLVVEGEKCVDLLQPLVEGRLVVVAWMGGTGAVEKVDWQALWQRNVTLWPDFDHLQPGQTERGGQKAMNRIAEILKTKQVNRLRMVDLSDFTEAKYKSGYDVGDMLTEGKSVPDILAFLKAKTKSLQAVEGKEQHSDEWLPQGVTMIQTAQGGMKRDDSSNSWLVLNYHPRFKGRFTYDVFDQVALVDNEPVTEAKLQNLRLEITQRTGLLPKGSELQRQVEGLALEHKVNRFADQLRGLVWDQTPRLAPSALQGASRGLLIDYANCEDTPLNRVLGMRWMVGAAQRVLMDPNDDEGFQHDGMLVLEGDQGLGKTSFLRRLGSLFNRPLYTELQGALGSDKDNMLKLRGKVIVELAEMTAHRRSEEGAFKAFIDRKVDEYRPPYGAGMVRQPRMVVFAGTTNQQAYLTDPTGNRRIWPAVVEREIDTRILDRDLEQIWAEAVWLAQNGERNYLQGDELAWHAEVISGRDQIESWDEMLEHLGVFELWPVDGLTISQIFDLEGVKIPLKDRTKGLEQRIKDVLTKRGYQWKKGSPTGRGQTRRMAWRARFR